MKLGSLFDGSGTCPLAASAVGIIPAWASEIEPFPKAVTQSRFPKMVHLGDITKMNGAEIEPVDVITFGSPCQNYAEETLLCEAQHNKMAFPCMLYIMEGVQEVLAERYLDNLFGGDTAEP